MADKLISIGDGSTFKRMKDMGDGTYAEVVSVKNAAFVNPATDDSAVLVGSGVTVQLSALAPGVPTYVTFGDSVTANAWAASASGAATLSRTGSVVTVTQAAHPFMSGMKCSVELFTILDNVLGEQAVTYIDSSHYSFVADGTVQGADNSASGRVRCPYQLSDNGWATWMKFALGRRMRWIWNAARGGDTTTQMLARFDADVVARAPTYVFVMGGVNDAPSGIPGTTTLANLKAMYAKARAAGIRVVALTITPDNVARGAGHSAANTQTILDVNTGIRRECMRYPQMLLADAHRVTVDPNSATGADLTGMLSPDGLHPAPRGALAIGFEAAAVVSPFLPIFSTLCESAADNRAVNAANSNLWPSLPSTASGGGISGTNVTGSPPVLFSVQTNGGSAAAIVASGVARTLAADGDTVGYNCRAVFTPAAIGNECRILQQTSFSATATVGKAYIFECAVGVTNNAGILSGLSARVQYTIDGVTYTFNMLGGSGYAFPAGDFKGIFGSVPFVLTGAALTNIDVRVTAIAGATGSAVTIDVGRVSFREADAAAPVSY